MTPEEAIEVLGQLADDSYINLDPAGPKAINLGIEAIKFRKRWEEQEGEDDFPLLPGETKV